MNRITSDLSIKQVLLVVKVVWKVAGNSMSRGFDRREDLRVTDQMDLVAVQPRKPTDSITKLQRSCAK
jgi:hypothetical protein